MTTKTTIPKKTTNSTIPKKDEETAMTLPGDFSGFTDDEVTGGVDTVIGYMAQYPYLVKVQGSNFEIIEQATGNIVKTLPVIDTAVVFYAHSVYRLHRGTVDGVQGPMQKWSDDEKEVLAISYDNPFGRLHNSRGNFDVNDLGQWLDNKEARKSLVKRMYCFMSLPGLLPKGSIAAASFGITAQKSFNAVKTECNSVKTGPSSAGVPLPAVALKLTLVPETNADGLDYDRVNFEILKKDEVPVTTIKNVDDYRTRIKPILDKIIETHKEAVKQAEQMTGSISSGAIQDIEDRKNETSQQVSETASPFTDDNDDIDNFF